MAEILLFHHAHGLTAGVRTFAESLRQAGHTVHTPDLFNGRVFDDLDTGIAYARQVGFGSLVERGRAAAEALPRRLVYAGFSLGVLPAQMLACSRAGARGAVLLHACVAISELGGACNVPVQIHAMADDAIFVGEGDLEAARALVQATSDAELFLYPGAAHLFADNSLSAYNARAASLLMERVLAFLDRLP